MSIRLKDTIYDLINNADKIDGLDSTSLFRKLGTNVDINTFADGSNKNGIIYINTTTPANINAPFSYGTILSFNSDAGSWMLGNSSSGVLKFRNRWWSGNGATWSDWKDIAFKTDIPTIPTALKNPKALTIQNNGTTVDSYDGSAAKTINITHPTIPTSLKCPTSLTIQFNGTSQGAWDGSTAKTINITPAAIGAATTHSHPYLPLSGGTLSGSGYVAFSSPASTSVTDSTAFAITYGKIQAAAPISIIADTDGTSTEYIIMTSGYTAANATKANGLAVGKNELTWKNSAILTASNAASTLNGTYVNVTGDTMTGALSLPLSGINVGNNCSSDTNTYRAFRAYNSNLSTSYAGGNTIYICAGHSASAGNAGEFGFTYAGAASTSNSVSMGFNAGNRLKLYYSGSSVGIAKICSSISGGTEYTLLHEGNYSTWAAQKSHTHDDRYFTESEINTKLGNYLPLSGGTMTGTLTIPLSKLVIGGQGGDTATTRVLMAYGTETNKYINLGYNASAGNCAELAWGYSGSASTSNYTYLGFYGGYGLYIYYNSNVLRLGTASSYKTICFTDHTHSQYLTSLPSHNHDGNYYRNYVGGISSSTLNTFDSGRVCGSYTISYSGYSGALLSFKTGAGSVSSIEFLAEHYDVAYGLKMRFAVDNNRYTGWRSFSFSDHTHSYLPLSGGTLTGSLTFANGTWNVVGDDAAIGDYNAAGMLGLKSCNNALPGIGFHNNSNTLLGTLICNAGTLTWNKTFNCATLQIGGESITFTT